MADVTVFVDAAVLGTLPPVCVKDGSPTHDHLTIDSEISGRTGLGVAWLLILFGPLGWLGLIVIAIMRRPSDVLTVRLPFSEQAYQHYRLVRRMRRTWFAAAFVLAVLALTARQALHPLGGLAGLLLGLCAFGAFVGGLVEWHRVRSATVGVTLDASRRWVTLTRVHPAFERAVAGPGVPPEHGRWAPHVP